MFLNFELKSKKNVLTKVHSTLYRGLEQDVVFPGGQTSVFSVSSLEATLDKNQPFVLKLRPLFSS